MRILYCGPFISECALSEKRAVNQAAAKWSRELLQALSQIVDVDVISHCPEQRWPAGKVFWQNNDKRWFNDFLSCERIAYPNVVGVKDAYLSIAYRRAVRRLVKQNKYDALICYNTLHPYHVAAMKEARRYGIKCVPIILDGDDPRRDDWGWIKRSVSPADGIVFLSWWMKENFPNKDIPLLHMDGGAQEFQGESPSKNTEKTFTIVHAGALDYWRGLNFMKEVVKLCKRQDVRFVFCGKCDVQQRWAEFNNDPRVEIKGFLPDDEVNRICRAADILLSVREPKVGDNVVNYPSKIPQYLSWGKPIVSTWVPSFSPDYRDVLEVPDEDSPNAFVRKIDEVLGWGADEKVEKFKTIKDWFENRKSWANQVRRLIEFIHSI